MAAVFDMFYEQLSKQDTVLSYIAIQQKDFLLLKRTAVYCCLLFWATCKAIDDFLLPTFMRNRNGVAAAAALAMWWRVDYVDNRVAR